uniref:AlNc14C34G3082 protein n=1 Tax=Albugo laibachii Nc14 TaxID=890382 RepID=F0W8F2_9STRA|nr:AlNc14C34G3082 [Albugo laibachii Nc14]|eukprot:CCA17407.1 AlNc14C34G3082 [Albugo laibachii Nc14]
MDVDPTPRSNPAAPPTPFEVDDRNASSSSPPTFNEPDPKAHRPTLVDILKASDLQAIDRLFEDDLPSWDVLSAYLIAAKAYVIPTARFSAVLETGQAFVRSPPAHILQSFARDHGNKIVGELLHAGKIGHVGKLPGGNPRLLVTSEDHSFRAFDILRSRYFVDIFGLGPEISTSTIIFALHSLGCDILYENSREAATSQRLAMSTYRVYIRSTCCPAPLLISGKVCEQLFIDGRYYLARDKIAPILADRLSMGQRSPYCLQLPVETPKPHQPPLTSTGPSNGSEKSPATETPTAAGSPESILEDKGSPSLSTGFILNVYGRHE